MHSLEAALTLDDIYDDVPIPPLTVGENEDDEDWAGRATISPVAG